MEASLLSLPLFFFFSLKYVQDNNTDLRYQVISKRESQWESNYKGKLKLWSVPEEMNELV